MSKYTESEWLEFETQMEDLEEYKAICDADAEMRAIEEFDVKEKAIASYLEKNKYMATQSRRVSAYQFYRNIFPLGEFERAGHFEDNKPNGIVTVLEPLANDSEKKYKTHRYTVTDDLDELLAPRDYFTITSPVSFFGKHRSAKNARFLYALAIDLDGVEIHNLRDVVYQMQQDVIPKANYIINSGNGLHLYYHFTHTIPMTPSNQQQLKHLKDAIVNKVWNSFTSSRKDPEYHGITQGFRVVDSPTKLGKEYPVTAFQTKQKKWDIEDLINTITHPDDLEKIKAGHLSKMSLSKAKEKYPAWYAERIEKKKPKGEIPFNRAIYDDWLRKIREYGKVGYRYNCILTLSAFARKASIYHPTKNPNPVTFAELKKDAYALHEQFERQSYEENNHFTRQDIEDAIKTFKKNDYTSITRHRISQKTNITIIPKIRRNGRKQAEHLKRARMMRDINQSEKGTKWTDGNGRPSKQTLVENWQAENPDKKKADCIRALKIDRKTVSKYWKK